MAVSKFTSASGGNDFNINVGSTYSVVNFTQEYAAGSYSFTSAQLDITMDVYAYNAQGTLVGYTNGKGLTASSGFIKLVIIGGTVGDVLSFTYKTTFYSNAETAELTAGPVILSVTPTALPNSNSTTLITGLNFATDVAATFTGSDNLVRVAKSVVRGSVNSLVVTRPDSFPITYSPYTLTVTNPSVAYQPTGSAANSISVTAGVVPIWNTVATFSNIYTSNITFNASDPDGGATMTYTLVSGALPTGSSLNSSTGLLTVNASTGAGLGTFNFTLRATDDGGNTADRAFTVTQYISMDVLVVAGGGGGSSIIGGGGGAGGMITASALVYTAGSFTVTVGAGGRGGTGYSDSASAESGFKGANSVFGTLTAIGGGGASGWSSSYGQESGGSSAGGSGTSNSGTGTSPGTATSQQGNVGGTGSDPAGGGGGGGAGGAGAPNGGNGGAGLASTITGTSVTYAGGGGSGRRRSGGGEGPSSGGSGGGGMGMSGGSFNSNQNGTNGLGGGGGGGNYPGPAGGGNNQAGGTGGSGTVILAYPSTYPAITTIPGTLTYTVSTSSRSGYRVYSFTGGTGTVSI